jgi:hypothetical protein
MSAKRIAKTINRNSLVVLVIIAGIVQEAQEKKGRKTLQNRLTGNRKQKMRQNRQTDRKNRLAAVHSNRVS